MHTYGLLKNLIVSRCRIDDEADNLVYKHADDITVYEVVVSVAVVPF